MIFVGIDVASTKHDCFIMDDNGVLLSSAFTIENNSSGYKKLHETINKFAEPNHKVYIGLESTGHYSENILIYFAKTDHTVFLINPLLTSMERKTTSVRKTKTDVIDCQSICTFISKNHSVLKPYTIKLYHMKALKSLSRSRFKIIKSISAEKNILKKLITQAFPEFLQLFDNIYSNSALSVLENYSTISKINNARVSSIQKLLHGRCKITASMIKDAAKNSIGQDDEFLGFEIKSSLSRIRFLEEQVESYDEQISSIMDIHGKSILSIPGIGIVTGASILAEIGDITNFKTPDKLLAYAGLDPTVYQSGNYNASNVKISKRGSSYLRNALYLSATSVWRFDDTFKKYYEKKQSEGKHYYVILGHIQKKLVRVIHSILKNNSIYETK